MCNQSKVPTPITYEEYKDMKTTEIAARVEDAIRETIKKYNSSAS